MNMSVNAAPSAPGQNRKTVTTLHREYRAMSGKWQRCRDAAAGSDAIKGDRALNYLPKLEQQEEPAYQSYLKRACFFNATWRTISGLCGMLFRKPEQIEAPDPLRVLFDDISLNDESLNAFALKLAVECFTVGRAGVLVDYPTVGEDGTPLTRARAEAMNLRPVLKRYCAENIINWRTEVINNVTRLTMVVLTEEHYQATDEFSGTCETRYRVLDLVRRDGAGSLVYRVRVFRINKQTDSQEQVGGDFYPLMNGAPLDFIPFVFFGVDSITVKVDDPPLIDLVDLNLAHFRVSADFEHGCHFTGLPTPVVSGYQPATNDDKLYVGSTMAWVFPDPAAHASYLEFGGAGLGMLQGNLTHKEEQMAALGARLLTTDRRSNETATTAAIHHGGETAVLASVAQVLSQGMSQALSVFAKWAGYDDEISYAINRDFIPMQMDGNTLGSLVASWQAGAISFETLFQNLQRGEIIAAETTMEDEQARITNAAPTINSPEFIIEQTKAEPPAVEQVAT